MNNKLRSQSGKPLPLGASLVREGINFSIFSRHAETVTLVLEVIGNKKNSIRKYSLSPETNKTGDIWHILLPKPRSDFYYGYEISGKYDPLGQGHMFDNSRILLDPYARELRSLSWGKPWQGLGYKPFCKVIPSKYDWEGDRPLNIPLKDSIIYEMHVRGFTCHRSSQSSYPGTYYGIIDKIDYLKELGVTAVELMPVTEFDENESYFSHPESGKPLKNYWGYSPLSFFAPKSGYCNDPNNPINEFRDMVKALHKAGIEVILDIVYNHTGEGGIDGPTTSFRGIDNTIYYLLDPWTRAYLNFSGCGNTCNCNHPIVRNLIIDALHWWVTEMHVDGFRFDLASILGRDSKGNVLANPPVVEAIAEDPVLADTKIIAEAWDAAGLYQVGSFSTHHRWAEWNGRYRDDIRSFMCGHHGKVPNLATRIAGSSDLYKKHNRRPCNSINFITSHDGFTLEDLVSYNEKHNYFNGEENRDGENNNLSWNSGFEGPSQHTGILNLRNRRKKTMLVILFLSQGVPMMVAGDEFGRTQLGNNNAWCQDNETSWLNWDLLAVNRDLFNFVQFLIHLRKKHSVFRRDEFFMTQKNEAEPPHIEEISWHGIEPEHQDWSHECTTLGFLLHGNGEPDSDFYIMLNGDATKDVHFTIPKLPSRRKAHIWKKIIDTGKQGNKSFAQLKNAQKVEVGDKIKVPHMGCSVLQSDRKKTVV